MTKLQFLKKRLKEQDKYIESVILHFDTANENRWAAMSGCLDDFLLRAAKAKKSIPACYQHDESIVIGLWKDLTITGNVLSISLPQWARIYTWA